MRSIELFAGCGGLALGLSRAGFKHELVVERDAFACATLRYNKMRRVEHVSEWELWSDDVAKLDYAPYEGQIDLISGGPPCQPFSIGGKHLGPDDSRNMWPEAARAVREVLPKAFVFENVKGLLREAFAEYLEYTLLQLTWPELDQRLGENWLDHRDRLLCYRDLNKGAETYRVVVRSINAADYGAAQKRHRVIIAGVRSDVAPSWSFPDPTHSIEALAWAKAKSGAYWSEHGIPESERSPLNRDELSALRRFERTGGAIPSARPWVTVRERLSGLQASNHEGSDWNHVQHPGARSYAGHTGCHLDEPAKALKAGMHGVPGGENIIAAGDGSVRYFTVREMARLQGFPDDFVVTGTWGHVTRQLGNAVPTEVGENIGKGLANILASPTVAPLSAPSQSPKLGKERRADLPKAHLEEPHSIISSPS